MLSPIGDFSRRFLARHGALVEPGENELVALMPPALASDLGLAEYQRLNFDSRAAAGTGLLVDYDSPLVERFERLVEDLGRAAFVPALRLPLKTIDPTEAITRAITLTNGVMRECRLESAEALYVGFFVQYELLADERVSGMTDVWVNTTMRSVPRLAGVFDTLLPAHDHGVSAVPPEGDAGPHDFSKTLVDAWTLGAALATRAVENRLQDSIESLRRRRERDFTRLREYYAAIDDELRRRVRRALAKGDEAGATAETSRLDATARTYRARITDLVDRYRARVRIRPIGALACMLPVHQVTARFHRRSASRAVEFAWNPIDRAIEPPCCEVCGIGTSTVVLCDDRVHLFCPTCIGRCTTCGKPYCRACHARCPRQHEQDRARW